MTTPVNVEDAPKRPYAKRSYIRADGTNSRCSVCKSKHKAQYHALRATGTSFDSLEAASRGLGTPIKSDTFSRHFRRCLGGRNPGDDLSLAQSVERGVDEAKTQQEMDFAIAVRARATQLLQSGDLRVTASHGLQAQALLDRRAEKAADRDLAINLARLMSGAISITPIEVIEGRSVELLAPGDVVEPRA